MTRSKSLSRKGVCSRDLKEPSPAWKKARKFLSEVSRNKKSHPVAHAKAEKWVQDNLSTNGDENQENYLKRFKEYLKCDLASS